MFFGPSRLVVWFLHTGFTRASRQGRGSIKLRSGLCKSPYGQPGHDRLFFQDTCLVLLHKHRHLNGKLLISTSVYTGICVSYDHRSMEHWCLILAYTFFLHKRL